MGQFTGTNANSFVTGFMSGYKFVDDIVAKKAEQEYKMAEYTKKLKDAEFDDLNKVNTLKFNAQKEANDSISNINKIEQDENLSDEQKVQLTNPIRDTMTSVITNANSTLEAMSKQSGKVYEPIKVGGSLFNKQTIITDGENKFIGVDDDTAKYVAEQMKLPKEQRLVEIDKAGVLRFRREAGGEFVASDISYKVAKDATKTQNIDANSPADMSKLSQEVVTYFKKIGVSQPTVGDVNNYVKTVIGSDFMEPKVMYKDDKKITVNTSSELADMLKQGWSDKAPDSNINIGDIRIANYKEWLKNNPSGTFTQFEAQEAEQGKQNVTNSRDKLLEAFASKTPIPSDPVDRAKYMQKMYAINPNVKPSDDVIKNLMPFEKLISQSKTFAELIKKGDKTGALDSISSTIKQYFNFKDSGDIGQFNALTNAISYSLAKSEGSGAISDKDLSNAMQQVTDTLKSDSTNAGIFSATLSGKIEDLKAYINMVHPQYYKVNIEPKVNALQRVKMYVDNGVKLANGSSNDYNQGMIRQQKTIEKKPTKQPIKPNATTPFKLQDGTVFDPSKFMKK